MSAPRPYETYPFHPPALFTSYTINQFQYIYKTVADISSMWCLHYVLQHCTCHLRMRSFRTTNFKVQRHFEVILASMWYVLVRDTARKCY